MTFALHYDKLKGPLEIQNRKSMPWEPASYIYEGQDPKHYGFALVAFLPNLNRTGSVLVVQGFTVARTQAAAEFVANDQDFDSLFDSICRKSAGVATSG
jgi:hypothetical protein